MKETIPHCNRTLNLRDCSTAWCLDMEHQCWCLEDVLYTEKATVPKFQRLSIFVPYAYMNANGALNPSGRIHGYTTASAPVVFENNSAGFLQMPHTWLGGPRCHAKPYLSAGFVYVTCGCRGRDSVDERGQPAGAEPLSLVDLKTALRFLRHNRSALPGNWDRVISVGTGSGGTLSALLAASGDSPLYSPYLQRCGACMAESDAVFAAQVYCPDLETQQADAAYEWLFSADPAGEAEEEVSPFRLDLSRAMARQYVEYFNALRLHDPENNVPLFLGTDGRSGSAYRYFLQLLEASATAFFKRLSTTCSPEDDSVAQYLDGRYTTLIPVREPGDIGLPEGWGERLCRPPRGIPYVPREPVKIRRQGDAKRAWLHWDGQAAHITSLDDFVKFHRRRVRPCPRQMPPDPDPAQEANRLLLEPLSFLEAQSNGVRAAHYRIRMGTDDAESAFVISLVLALRLREAGVPDVDYALVWDQPHGQADPPGAVCRWIDRLCAAESPHLP